MLILIVLTEAASSLLAPVPLQVDGKSIGLNVLPADLIWSRVYGGQKDDRAYDAVPAGNGFLVVGSSKSIVQNTMVGWAIKLDSEGNAVWNKTFLEGTNTELRFAINLTDGFLLVGNEYLPSGNINGFAAKISPDGTLVWQTLVGNNNETDEFYSGMATSDGFVLMGLSSQNGGQTSQAWVVKIDDEGSLVWSKTLDMGLNTVARAGLVSSDGDYVVTGYTDSRGLGSYDFLLLKIDPNGDLIWNQTYGTNGSQEAHSITAASDGYVMVGDTQSTGTEIHAWVVKVDWNGTELWSETVGGDKSDSPAYVTASTDGGYLVAGFTFSWGAGNRDFWLFKIDDSGKVLWSCTQGDVEYQEAYGVIQTAPNQYVMIGWTDPPGQPALIGKAQYDFYIVNVTPLQADTGALFLQAMVYGLAIVCVALALSLFAIIFHGSKKSEIKRKSLETP